MKAYIKSIGFEMTLTEIFEDIEHHCEITRSDKRGWPLLNYFIVINDAFKYDPSTPLAHFNAIFQASNSKIFLVKYNFYNRVLV
jgi:hypothetical protein